MSTVISKELISVIKNKFILDWNGIHGSPHWSRVRNNGLKLSKMNGANSKVVEYFAFLHDSCRLSDGYDENHGRRAAAFAKSLLGQYIFLNDLEFSELEIACNGHSDGLVTHKSISVLTCWDADRLDLGRVDIFPDPKYLCTNEAKNADVIQWAFYNSQS